MKASHILANWRVLAIAGLVIGIGATLLIAARQSPGSDEPLMSAQGEIWTCSMHPQVRLPKPGKCPICSMPLVKAALVKDPTTTNRTTESMLKLSDHAREMASVETATVQRRKLFREIRAVGKVQYNESGLANITTRVEGYAERLYVDYTGAEVKAGEHLVDIYSPDLLVAQQELIVALEGIRNETNLVESARRKLLLWGMSEHQVEDLMRNKRTTERVTFLSPISGTVIEKMVVQKAMVKPGEMLYRVAKLDSVWVYLDVFESDLPWVQYGQKAEIQSETLPTEKFAGRVWLISPVLSEETRTIKVLLNIDNRERKLKPGMYVNAILRSQLLANGKAAATGVEGQWSCPMHPLVIQSQSGQCPVCGMTLVQIPGSRNGEQHEDEILAVPIASVLDSGTRKLVYVEKEKGEFEPREIATGVRTDDAYPVFSGLHEGEKVAIRGAFMLDSQLQIRGLPSLFYIHGQTAGVGHQHGSSAVPIQSGRESPEIPPPHKH